MEFNITAAEADEEMMRIRFAPARIDINNTMTNWTCSELIGNKINLQLVFENPELVSSDDYVTLVFFPDTDPARFYKERSRQIPLETELKWQMTAQIADAAHAK